MDPHAQRIQTICLLIVSTLAVAAALYWLRPVLVPFVLAVFIAYGLLPLVEFQVRHLRLPQLVAVASTLLVGVLILGSLGLLISTSVSQLQANAAAYQQQIELLGAKVSAFLPAGTFRAEGNPFTQLPLGNISGMLLHTTNAIVGLLSQGLLVLIFVLYLLLGGARHNGQSGGVWAEIEKQVEHYIVTKALISLATGVLVGLTLAVLGVDLALVFGLLAFLLNFIPSVGSIIATLLPVPVVVVSPDISTTTATLAILLPGLIQIIIGNIIEPKVMGEALDLHPIVILMTLIVWGMLWGVVGMLLATPMTAILKILFERLEPMAPVAQVLAGRLDAFRS
jgi:AI-2 transport protein TqsA